SEAILGGAGAALVEQPREVAAQNLDVAAHHDRGQRGDGAAPLPKEDQVGTHRAVLVNRLPEPHALEDLAVHGAAEVDRLAALAQRGRPLDNRGLPTPPERARQGGAGNARSADQDTWIGHGRSLRTQYAQ